MRTVPIGERVSVFTDKWSVVRDLEAFAHLTENALIGFVEEGSGWRVTLQRLATSRLKVRPERGSATGVRTEDGGA